MATTSPVSIGTALNQQQKTSNSSKQLSEDFDQFLRLLTTQLQNQDPLDPMDSAQFTQQLVAFSGVEQQINTNQKLDNLVALNLNNALNSSLGYVGMDISYLSAEMNFDGTTPVKVTYALDGKAASNNISITDETGKVVFQKTGALDTGKNELTWDGSLTNGGHAPAGTYTVKINAFDSDGNLVKSTSVVTGRVKGVETQDGVINLLVGDRAVPLGNVLNAIKPMEAPAAI